MTVAGAVLRADDGTSSALALGRWLGTPPLEEQRLLSRVESPVLDVGCGPGRHTLALAQRGVMVLGVDVAASAVATAREREVPVLERSVFDRLPGERRWATALLLDGNVGIGGSPERLLSRIRELLSPRGRVLVELGGPGAPSGIRRVRVERADATGPWFYWAWVGVDDVVPLAKRTGLALAEVWSENTRWFAEMRVV
jgi:SAM-dependent methyltransferase